MKQIYTILILLSVGFLNLYSQGISNQNIGKILNESGSIKPNTTGSYNTAGYEMTYGNNKEPIFKKIDPSVQTSIYGWGSVGSGRNGTSGTGTSGTVYAMAVDSIGNIYVGGQFTFAGDIPANFIAKWNTATGTWSSLASGASNGVHGAVMAIAISGTYVYVGGSFSLLGDGTTSANNIARWNGTTWSTLTSGSSNGVNNVVRAISVSGSDVYVGGQFTLLGDGTTSAKYIAKWSTATSSWSTITSGLSNGLNSHVLSMAISGTDIYVGGNFTFLGDGTTSANYIVKWNTTTSTWSTLTSGSSNGVNSNVLAIAISGTDVYMGGAFSKLGDGSSAKSIAKWNGTAWSTLASGSSNGVNGTVYAIAISGTDVYVGGQFTLLGDLATSANNIVKWNPAASTWSTLASGSSNGVNNPLQAIAVSGSNVYIGGDFTFLGNGSTVANYIVKWNGSNWSAIGSGNNGVKNNVLAIAISGTDVYVGGNFTFLGDDTTSAKYIAKWNNAAGTWSTLTSGTSNGVNGTVNAIAISGSDVYVGGRFTLLGDGTSAKYIAKWNTTAGTWSTLASGSSNGVNNSVYAIAINGTDVYVGGQFTLLGDGTTSAKYIAKWNGTSWSSLTSGASNGVNSTVRAIAISGTDVYVGGQFTLLGDGTTSANYIAKWNGAAWSALTGGGSNGVNNFVYAIAFSGTDVYVGGNFTLLGDATTPANYIAKWNGAAWSALSDGGSNGVNGQVNAIAISGTDVYVGGNFTFLGNGTTPANYLSKWNGTTWSAIDDGANASVYAMQVSPADGKDVHWGNFKILNNNTGAFYVGTFTDPGNPMPVELKSFSAHSNGSSVTLNWQTASEVKNYGFDVQRTLSSQTAAWEKIGFVRGHGNSNTANEYSFSDKNLQSGKYQYRLKMIDKDGSYKYSDVSETEIGLPNSFELTQNYPNPFNPSTRINYQVPVDAKIILEVYSITGQKVAELVNQDQLAGYYSISFSSSSAKLASGVYIYKIAATEKASGNNFTGIKKMILIK